MAKDQTTPGLELRKDVMELFALYLVKFQELNDDERKVFIKFFEMLADPCPLLIMPDNN